MHYIIDKCGSKRQALEVECTSCGKVFLKDKRDVKKRKIHFCNQECYKQYHQQGTCKVDCGTCGKEISRPKARMNRNKSGIYFCSNECRIVVQRIGGKYPSLIPSHYRDVILTPCVGCEKNCKKEYCSAVCRNKHKYLSYIQRWKDGLESGNLKGDEQIHPYIRRYMFDKYESKCCQCGWNKVHPITQKIPLTINHIDGISSNSIENNLELLCPNCHSLTPNYGSLNIGNGRKNRLKNLGDGTAGGGLAQKIRGSKPLPRI